MPTQSNVIYTVERLVTATEVSPLLDIAMQYDALQCVNGSLFRCQTGNINVTESVVSKRRSPRLPTVGTNVFVVLDIIPFVVVASKITHNVIFVEFAVNYHLAVPSRSVFCAYADVQRQADAANRYIV